MSSNLPPGVTPSMIPGNTPDDMAEEKFWDLFFEKCSEGGVTGDIIDNEWDNDSAFAKAVRIARDLGYERGFGDGRAEADIDRMLEEAQDEGI